LYLPGAVLDTFVVNVHGKSVWFVKIPAVLRSKRWHNDPYQKNPGYSFCKGREINAFFLDFFE